MAEMIAKGFSDLLKLNIVLDPSQAQQGAGKPIPTLDLDSLHKYSLHWVSSGGFTVTLDIQRNNESNNVRIPSAKSTDNLTSSTQNVASSLGDTKANINVTVKTLTGRSTVLNVKPTAQVSELKDIIRARDGLENQGIKLLHHNKKLKDEATLQQSNIVDSTTLFMIVSIESIAPTFYMNVKTFLDPGYDYQYADSDGNTRFSRGNRNFIRPCGWTKRALLVLGKYETDGWLGVSGRQSSQASVSGEWPVAYHGTKKDAAEAFCKQGGTLKSRGRYYAQGKGIYTTPSPILAEEQTDIFNFQGQKYKMIFMDRICMDYTAEYYLSGHGGGTYFITSNEKVRPYCVLFKRV